MKIKITKKSIEMLKLAVEALKPVLESTAEVILEQALDLPANCRVKEACNCVDNSETNLTMSEIQQILNLKPEEQSGICDQRTKAAILKFQNENNIECDACVGDETHGKMFELGLTKKKVSTIAIAVGSSGKAVHRFSSGVNKSNVPSRMFRWNDLVEKYSAIYSLPTAMVYAIMYNESGGRPNVTGVNKTTCTEKKMKYRTRYHRKRVNLGRRVPYDSTKLPDCSSSWHLGKPFVFAVDRGLMQINDYWFYMDDYYNPEKNIEFGCWQLHTKLNENGITPSKRNSSLPDSKLEIGLLSYNAGTRGANSPGYHKKNTYGYRAVKNFHKWGGWGTFPKNLTS